MAIFTADTVRKSVRARPALALVLLLVVGVGLGCGEDGATPSLLRITPSPVVLGRVPVGNPARQTLVLSNLGDTAAVLGAVEVGAVLAGEIRLVGLPERIPAGARREVGLVYTPRTAGQRTDRLVFPLVGTTPAIVQVTATVVEEAVVFQPSELDLGAVPLGEVRSATVTVELVGASPLDLATATVLGDAAFGVVTSTPRRLFPGQTATVVVSFAPLSLGEATGEVFLGTADRVLGPLRVRGTGVVGALTVEPEQSRLGAVLIGDRKPHLLRLVSRARVSHRVAVRVEGDRAAFEGIEALEGTVELGPGDALGYPIAFAPQRVGTASVTVVAEVDGQPGRALAAVTGEGVADPQAPFALDPPLIELGPVELGATARRSVWLLNGATVDRPLTPSLVVTPADAPLLLTPEVPLGTALRGRDRHRLVLAASPVALGPREAELVFAGARLRVRWEGVPRPVVAVAVPLTVDLGVWTGAPSLDRRWVEVESTGTATAVVTSSVGSRAFAVEVEAPIAPGGRGFLVVTQGPEPAAAGTADSAVATLRPDGPDTTSSAVGLRVAVRDEVLPGPRLCASAPGGRPEVHLLAPGADLRDVPFAASACQSRAEDGGGGAWTVGAPGPGETCAAPLTLSLFGELLVAITVPRGGPFGPSAPIPVSVGPAGDSPRAVRWMAPGTRWDVGWLRSGGGLDLVDAPLAPEGPARCF